MTIVSICGRGAICSPRGARITCGIIAGLYSFTWVSLMELSGAMFFLNVSLSPTTLSKSGAPGWKASNLHAFMLVADKRGVPFAVRRS